MTLVTASDNTDEQRNHIQLSLSRPEAERLRVTLPWLVRALADQPTTPPRQRERRGNARTALEGLLSSLRAQLKEAEETSTSQ